MILTCPACDTKYVVKDGAIPAGGRQVRCASCKHSWHQDTDGSADPAPAPMNEATPEGEQSSEAAAPDTAPVERDADFSTAPPPPAPPPNDEGQWQQIEPTAAWDPPVADQATEPATAPAPEPAAESGAEDFEPFYDHEPIDQPTRKWPLVLLLVLLIALAAIAFWFLAPAELRQRVGLASTGRSQLHAVISTGNYQRLASGNNLFTVSGRVVNSTNERQPVPPIRAELLDETKQKVIYRWTIELATTSLDLNKSANFNSAEVDVPEGGKYIRVRLGGPA